MRQVIPKAISCPGRYLLALINNMLDMSEIDSGKLMLTAVLQRWIK